MKRPQKAGILSLALALIALAALGLQDNAQGLAPEETARAVSIVDGDTLVLDDGREVRLVGIQAPKLPLGRPDFPTWPLAEEAKAALAALALNRDLSLSYGGRRVDRHGRVLAHLTRDDGVWIQGRMLEDGMARVYSFFDNRALVPEMLALESEARATERGIWALPYYAVRQHDDLAEDIGSFQLVEGRVREAAVVRGRVYLNFADDWRRDFTINLSSKARKLFDAAGLDPRSLAGERVRVRGWLKSYNGPMIEASHPEQIERLPR